MKPQFTNGYVKDMKLKDVQVNVNEDWYLVWPPLEANSNVAASTHESNMGTGLGMRLWLWLTLLYTPIQLNPQMFNRLLIW